MTTDGRRPTADQDRNDHRQPTAGGRRKGINDQRLPTISSMQSYSSFTDCILEGYQLREKLFAEVIKSLGVFFGYVIPSLNQLHAGYRF